MGRGRNRRDGIITMSSLSSKQSPAQEVTVQSQINLLHHCYLSLLKTSEVVSAINFKLCEGGPPSLLSDPDIREFSANDPILTQLHTLVSLYDCLISHITHNAYSTAQTIGVIEDIKRVIEDTKP